LGRQRLRGGQGLGFRKGLAENNLETARHRGFRGGTGCGGEQDQQRQCDSMAGNRQSKGQPYPVHRDPPPDIARSAREYRNRGDFAAATASRDTRAGAWQIFTCPRIF
jgi:hypothetical protein